MTTQLRFDDHELRTMGATINKQADPTSSKKRDFFSFSRSSFGLVGIEFQPLQMMAHQNERPIDGDHLPFQHTWTNIRVFWVEIRFFVLFLPPRRPFGNRISNKNFNVSGLTTLVRSFVVLLRSSFSSALQHFQREQLGFALLGQCTFFFKNTHSY